MEGEYIINIGKRTIIKMNMKIMTRKNATRRRLRLLPYLRMAKRIKNKKRMP